MKAPLFFFPLLISSLSFGQPDSAKFRPLQLKQDSKFLVRFDTPGLFSPEGLVWKEDTPTEWKECKLKIQSYYDDALTKKLKKAVYTIAQSHGQTNLWPSFAGNFQQRDHFIYWLTTENKDLPYLSFECYWQANHRAPHPFFTLENVAAFTGLYQFFWQPVLPEGAPRLTIGQIVTKNLQVETLMDLAFSAKKAGSGFSLNNPHFTDGKPSIPGERYACSISYNKDQDLDEYSIVMPKGQKAILQQAWETGNLLSLGFKAGQIRLELFCVHDGLDPLGFLQHHLQGVVRLTEL